MKAYYLLPALALTLLAASCAKEAPQDSGPLPMRIEATLVEESTKASLETDDLEDFYLQVRTDDPEFNYFTQVTRSLGYWTSSVDLFWKSATASTDFCAARFGDHAFTADEFANGVDLAVPSGQRTQSQFESADLLSSAMTTVKYEDCTGGRLPVALRHALAKVSILIKVQETPENANISYIQESFKECTLKDVRTGFHFQPTSGAVSALDAPRGDISARKGECAFAAVSGEKARASYEAILVPQTFASGGLLIYFAIGSDIYTWTNTTEITLAAGKNYDLTLDLD